MSASLLVLLVFSLLLPLAVLRVHFKRKYFADLRGPPSPSFILGHDLILRCQNEVGDLEFDWIRQYGNVFRMRGIWGEDTLMVADPKALQYIMHTSRYNFPKRLDADQMVRLIAGRGIVWASGADHMRHRKIMGPAFTAPQLRSFLPIFHQTASILVLQLKEKTRSGKTSVLDMSGYLSKTTLDIIGQSSFGCHFGALDEAQSSNELLDAFRNLFADTLLNPTASDLIFQSLWKYIPPRILDYVEYFPKRECLRLRRFLKTAKKVAAQFVVKTKTTLVEHSHSKNELDRDVMSVVVRSNASEDPRKKLDDDEMLSQLVTILLAGHDSTSYSLSWLLMELSKHPDDQKRIRSEIAALKSKTSMDTAELTFTDLDSLAYTNAVIKESLRLHPIVPTLVRQAGREDVLPLSVPLKTKSGSTISSIPIPKGQNIFISVCSYNRLPEVWGKDADQWNPERFMGTMDKQVSLGVYANLLSFSAGVRACIGWRFALLEMQAIIVRLIDNFDFALPPGNPEIERKPAGFMVPMLKGRMKEGTQMPLRVSVLD